MLKILHRINEINQLKNIPLEFGVEMDIHGFGNDLVVHHDAFKNGVLFEDWLKVCDQKRFVIFNIKEEGIENKALTLIEQFNIHDFFLLDLSFPSIIKLKNKKFNKIAIRVSEYESYITTMSLIGQVNWVWLDLFGKFPLSKEQFQQVQKSFKICIVSPELHSLERKCEIKSLQETLVKMNVQIDAVCTKFPELW